MIWDHFGKRIENPQLVRVSSSLVVVPFPQRTEPGLEDKMYVAGDLKGLAK